MVLLLAGAGGAGRGRGAAQRIQKQVDAALLAVVGRAVAGRGHQLAALGREQQRVAVAGEAAHVAERLGLTGALQPQRVLGHRRAQNGVVELRAGEVGAHVAVVGAGAHQRHVGRHSGGVEHGFGVVAQGFAVAVAAAGHGRGRKRLPAAQAQLDGDVAGAALQQGVDALGALARVGDVLHQGLHLGQRGGRQHVAPGVQVVVPLPEALPALGRAGVALHLKRAGRQRNGRGRVAQGRGHFLLFQRGAAAQRPLVHVLAAGAAALHGGAGGPLPLLVAQGLTGGQAHAQGGGLQGQALAALRLPGGVKQRVVTHDFVLVLHGVGRAGLAQVGVAHAHVAHQRAVHAAHALVPDFGTLELVQQAAVGIVHGPTQVAERVQRVVGRHEAAEVVAGRVEHRHHAVHGVHQPLGRFHGHHIFFGPQHGVGALAQAGRNGRHRVLRRRRGEKGSQE